MHLKDHIYGQAFLGLYISPTQVDSQSFTREYFVSSLESRHSFYVIIDVLI